LRAKLIGLTLTAQPANVGAIAKGIGKDTAKKPRIVTPEGDPPSTLVGATSSRARARRRSPATS
jgi:hypothetical protein